MKRKIVIADASTLIGLSRIGQLNILREIFNEVIIPQSVYDEAVTESKYGSEGIKSAKYLNVEKITDNKMIEPLLGYLGRGEAEVLTLPTEKKAELILIEEKKPRKAARRAGFKVIGVLGLLLEGKNMGLIRAVKPFIEELNKQGFRLSEKVKERALKEARE